MYAKAPKQADTSRHEQLQATLQGSEGDFRAELYPCIAPHGDTIPPSVTEIERIDQLPPDSREYTV